VTEPGGTVDEMDAEECFRLLASMEVGRVAVSFTGGAPYVVPVTYVVDAATIVFRTDPGTKLDGLREHPASFQVDVIDPFHRVGWSVLIQGVAEELEPDPDLATALRPWVAGALSHWVRIVPVLVSGRRLVVGVSDEPPGPRGYV
jgi:nitroimidazol reductase NimA-like FMN-containing flavoprotein (pyridoxamine 5'-phosphate oxidase superfamily)